MIYYDWEDEAWKNSENLDFYVDMALEDNENPELLFASVVDFYTWYYNE